MVQRFKNLAKISILTISNTAEIHTIYHYYHIQFWGQDLIQLTEKYFPKAIIDLIKLTISF